MRDLRPIDSHFVSSFCYVEEPLENPLLLFLYHNKIGQLVQKIMISHRISLLMGKFYESKFSKLIIKNFIKKNSINMEDYIKKEYTSFNDFFTRKKKNINFSSKTKDFCSPCDGFLSAYAINKDSKFLVKGITYSLESLLKSPSLSKKYEHGYCYIFRLMPNHYHRYHYFDDGVFLLRKKIPGIFHTVRPVALKKKEVFIENTREYALLSTKHFKDIIFMEVGALGVGKIVNHQKSSFKKGEEKGLFMFGGSTVIILFEKNTIKEDVKLLENSKKGLEAVVQCGCIVGERL